MESRVNSVPLCWLSKVETKRGNHVNVTGTQSSQNTYYLILFIVLPHSWVPPPQKLSEPWPEISNNVVCATSKASDQPAHMPSLIRAFASHFNILWLKLLTEHHLEFLSLKGGCTGSSESTLVKIPHCWKSHVLAHLMNIITLMCNITYKH